MANDLDLITMKYRYLFIVNKSILNKQNDMLFFV